MPRTAPNVEKGMDRKNSRAQKVLKRPVFVGEKGGNEREDRRAWHAGARPASWRAALLVTEWN
ncbi:MAG: hypothetical protein EOO61_22875 [Hymenobacter sp.]|nr:MAG: hypothetical protein EOO61_22875 [Hymenobacter sp.]